MKALLTLVISIPFAYIYHVNLPVFITHLVQKNEINTNIIISTSNKKINKINYFICFILFYFFISISNYYLPWINSNDYLSLLLNSLWLFLLLLLFKTDKSSCVLPDIFTYPLILIGLITSALNHQLSLTWAMAVGAIILLGKINYFISSKIIKKQTLGYGDFKLLAGICAWMGWSDTLLIFLLSNVILVLNYICFKRKTIYAFGPYLIGSTLVVRALTQI